MESAIRPRLTSRNPLLTTSVRTLALAAMLALATGVTQAWALSEIQREELPAPGAAQPGQPPADGTQPPALPGVTPPTDPALPADPSQPVAPAPTDPGTTVPAAPTQTPAPEGQEAPAEGAEPAVPESDDPDKSSIARPDIDPNAPLPEVSYDVLKLPEPVRRMRQLLLDAAKSGNVENLRPLIGIGDGATQLSLADMTDDPVAYIKSQSGDPDGQEILAIMEEVLSAGYVHLDAGTPEELYVWPYFFAYPLDKLTPQQKVEMFKIVTASDFEEMQNFGNYIFFRLGISPDGRWAFFVAGE